MRRRFGNFRNSGCDPSDFSVIPYIRSLYDGKIGIIFSQQPKNRHYFNQIFFVPAKAQVLQVSSIQSSGRSCVLPTMSFQHTLVTMQQERRQHIRYPLESNALALVLPGPDAFITLFSSGILDISMGGLAFSYVGKVSWIPNGYLLEIVDQKFHLDKVSISVVSDHPLHSDSGAMRRCGVKFNRLTREQRDKLSVFIRQHTALAQ